MNTFKIALIKPVMAAAISRYPNLLFRDLTNSEFDDVLLESFIETANTPASAYISIGSPRTLMPRIFV